MKSQRDLRPEEKLDTGPDERVFVDLREHACRHPSLDSERFARRGTEGHSPEAANTPL